MRLIFDVFFCFDVCTFMLELLFVCVGVGVIVFEAWITRINSLYGAFNEFSIDVHGILVEPVIKIISDLLILGFPRRRFIQIVFVEGMFEDYFWFNLVHAILHLYIRDYNAIEPIYSQYSFYLMMSFRIFHY